MTELLPKPKLENYNVRHDNGHKWLSDCCDYYKRLAEFQAEALEKYANQKPHYMWLSDGTYVDDAASFARDALSRIKQSEQS